VENSQKNGFIFTSFIVISEKITKSEMIVHHFLLFLDQLCKNNNIGAKISFPSQNQLIIYENNNKFRCISITGK
jgi:hypothetical protein